jgi:hypothetical protein
LVQPIAVVQVGRHPRAASNRSIEDVANNATSGAQSGTSHRTVLTIRNPAPLATAKMASRRHSREFNGGKDLWGKVADPSVF